MSVLSNKIKENIINDFNINLYRNFNLCLADVDNYFGYYNGYLYNLLNKIYNKHNAIGLRKETSYIIQYLKFLFLKLKQNSNFDTFELVSYYFRVYYRHFTIRKTENPNQLFFNF